MVQCFSVMAALVVLGTKRSKRIMENSATTLAISGPLCKVALLVSSLSAGCADGHRNRDPGSTPPVIGVAGYENGDAGDIPFVSIDDGTIIRLHSIPGARFVSFDSNSEEFFAQLHAVQDGQTTVYSWSESAGLVAGEVFPVNIETDGLLATDNHGTAVWATAGSVCGCSEGQCGGAAYANSDGETVTLDLPGYITDLTLVDGSVYAFGTQCSQRFKTGLDGVGYYETVRTPAIWVDAGTRKTYRPNMDPYCPPRQTQPYALSGQLKTFGSSLVLVSGTIHAGCMSMIRRSSFSILAINDEVVVDESVVTECVEGECFQRLGFVTQAASQSPYYTFVLGLLGDTLTPTVLRLRPDGAIDRSWPWLSLEDGASTVAIAATNDETLVVGAYNGSASLWRNGVRRELSGITPGASRAEWVTTR